LRYAVALLALYVVAAGLRVGWVAARYSDPQRSAELAFPDEEAYWHVARSLAASEGLVDEFGYRATYMPAYPAFLSLWTHAERPYLAGRLAQAALAALAAPLAAVVAWRWGRWVEKLPDRGTTPPHHGDSEAERRVLGMAGIAGVIVAFDPFLVFFSGLFLTEALFAVVVLAAWWFVAGAARCEDGGHLHDAFGAGVLILIGMLLRPAAVVVAAAAVLVVVVGRGHRLRRGIMACIIAAVIVAGLFPWALRNRQTIGQWRWLTTRGGISLYDGLHAGADGTSDLAHTKTIEAVQDLSETQWDAWFRARALEDARQAPVRVLRLAGRKFVRTWSLTPNVEEYRQGTTAFISAVFMGGVLATAVVGGWVHRRAVLAWFVLLCPVAAVTALHMVFVGSVRYRVPILPLIVVLSAAGCVHLLWRRRLGPTMGAYTKEKPER
jgi:hypothetical protein